MKTIFYFFAILLAFTLTAQGQEAPLESYVGKFNFPEGSPVPFVEVKINNGVLVGESQMGIATLQRVEGDIFTIVEYNGVAEFRRNGDGKVTGIKVSVEDLVMEGNKDGLRIHVMPWHPLSPLKF